MKPAIVLSAAAALLAGCASTQEDVHFRPEQGWELCRAPLPIETVGYVPGLESTRESADGWTQDERTNVAAAVAVAFALRCDASEAVRGQARGYRGITAVNSPNANQVGVYPAPDAARLYLDVPDYADYRSDAFLADVRNGIACGLAPGEAADPTACLPD